MNQVREKKTIKINTSRKIFRLCGVPLAIISVLSAAVVNAADAPPPPKKVPAANQDFSFDSFFLGPGSDVDLQRYNKGNPVIPGVYRIDLILNQTVVGRYDVKFALPENGEANALAEPCLSANFIKTVLGVKLPASEEGESSKEREPDKQCQSFKTLLPDADYDYDQGEQKLSLSIPQIYLQHTPRGWVPPEQWESGIKAVMLDYNANVFASNTNQNTFTTFYTGLQTGFNLGEYRLRHIGSFNWGQGSGTASQAHYSTSDIYVERDVTALKAQFRAGGITTQGNLFQGFRFRGITLFSDDRMLPDSLNGYAPTIRGTANSNAKVSVIQNGQILYQTTVAAGPFEINDLYPSSYSGELTVNIQEANGSVRVITIPYFSLPQLLRPRAQRFSISAGQYNNQTWTLNPKVAEVTYQRGISNNLTSYLGTQLTQRYQSMLLGSAINTGVGALSLEVTHSRTSLSDNSNYAGNSYRAAFSRLFDSTKTNLTLAAYRYSTSGYLSLQDAMAMEQLASLHMDTNTVERQKTRLEATVNQELPYDLGNIYVTAASRQFWNSGKQDSYVVGYNTAWRGTTLGVSYQNTHVYASQNNGVTNNEPYVQLTLTMPIGRSEHPQMLIMNHAQNTNGGQRSDQIGLSGSLGETGKASYFVSASQSGNGDNGSLNLGGNYSSAYGDLIGTSSLSKSYRQVSFAMSGGVVAYSGGLKFGPRLGSTFAIIEAPGAEGAHITNSSSVIGKDGLALANNLLPYRLNTLSIDPAHLPTNVQLDSSVHTFAPRTGSVTLVKYQTTIGRSLMMNINSKEVPFGAEIIDETNKVVGVVGQGGQVMILLVHQVGGRQQLHPKLWAKWGDSADQQCGLDYTQPTQPISEGGFERVHATCQMVSVSTNSRSH